MPDPTETPTIPVPSDVGTIEGTADGWRWQCADCGESPEELTGTFLTAWDGLRLHLEYEHDRRAHAAVAQAEALERIANQLEILCDLIVHQTATIVGGR